jgi:hypothetical protein
MTTIINTRNGWEGAVSWFVEEREVIGWHRECGDLTRTKKVLHHGNINHKYIGVSGRHDCKTKTTMHYYHIRIPSFIGPLPRNTIRGMIGRELEGYGASSGGLPFLHYTLQDIIDLRTKLLLEHGFAPIPEDE